MKKKLAVLMILTCLIILSACGKEPQEPLNSAEPEPTQIIAEETEPTFTVSAGGLKLKYPEKWKDRVSVTAEDDRVCFACGEVKLFDIAFNSEEGGILGTVKEEEYTVLYVKDYVLETEDVELYAMQEDINVILQNLMEDYDFEAGIALEKEDTSTIDIKTRVVTMKYPAKWQDEVQINVSDNGVEFSNNGTPLFDLVFSDCDGYLLGTYKATPIYIVEHPIDNEAQAAMIDDVNVILEHLMEDPSFTINH